MYKFFENHNVMVSAVYCVLMNIMPVIAFLLIRKKTAGRKLGAKKAYLSGFLLTFAVMIPVAMIENIRAWDNVGNMNISVIWGFALAAVITIFMVVKTGGKKEKVITGICLGGTGALMINFTAYYLNIALSISLGTVFTVLTLITAVLAVVSTYLSVYWSTAE